MAYLYYATCHNLKKFKINNENPLSNFKTKFSQTFFICHMSLCKFVIFMVIYKWHTIVYKKVKYLLTIDFIHICN